jgi:hypothetical protein
MPLENVGDASVIDENPNPDLLEEHRNRYFLPSDTSESPVRNQISPSSPFIYYAGPPASLRKYSARVVNKLWLRTKGLNNAWRPQNLRSPLRRDCEETFLV